MKTVSESWPTYIARLQTAKVLNAAQVNAWNKGQPVDVAVNIPFQKMRMETRTRQVPVTRMKQETGDNGETKMVPYTEVVAQTYTVQVPYMEMKSVSISLPASHTVAPNAVNKGVSYSGSSRAVSRSAAKRAQQLVKKGKPKKPSQRLIELMKIKPKQMNAMYDRSKDLEYLRLREFDKDGGKIEEVKSTSGQKIRQFR